jgi:hypothetical protein
MTGEYPEEPVHEPLTLARLLRLERGDRTLEQFASQMPVNEDTGVPYPGAKALERMLYYPLKNFPDPATIRSLALGTGRSEQDIVDACCRSLGIEVTRSGSLLVAMLPEQLGELDEHEIMTIVAMIRSWVSLHLQLKEAKGE